MSYTRRDDPVAHAWGGDFDRLAKHIEEGGELDDEMRGVLVAILRGELKFRKGIRRTFAQMQIDRDAALDIKCLMMSGLSLSGAIKLWLDENPRVDADTFKKMRKRAAADRRRRQENDGSLLGVIKSIIASPDDRRK